jgi:hypothetical protein
VFIESAQPIERFTARGAMANCIVVRPTLVALGMVDLITHNPAPHIQALGESYELHHSIQAG